jgi:CheY-like chemotaxis protein
MKLSEIAVLVVEDDELVRVLAADMAASAGHKVYQAAHADEAIQLLERNLDIRIVLTDVEMPGTMDGVKLAHYIRDRWPPIQLIVVSGAKVLAEKDLPLGASFLSKPYTHDHISEQLREMVTRINSPH